MAGIHLLLNLLLIISQHKCSFCVLLISAFCLVVLWRLWRADLLHAHYKLWQLLLHFICKTLKTANFTNFMLALGEYIEELTMYKSDDLIKELSKPTGGLAWVETREDDEVSLIQVDSNELKVGDIVVIGAGDTILVDGHILEGEALVNQISMTGEATPCQKNRGDRVLSGTIVQEGKIKVWAEGVGEDTAMSKIKTYIEETLVQKSKRELEASKMADSLVPITLGLATLSYVFTKDLMRLASVLQADYSCALKLTTPVTFIYRL